MPKPRLDRAREQRIVEEIVVDAYGPEERALSWYYYLEGKLVFPFKVRCVATRPGSPLKKEETVEALKLAPEDDCAGEIFVLVRVDGRRCGVPLSQLETLAADPDTREAIADWHYWSRRRYEF